MTIGKGKMKISEKPLKISEKIQRIQRIIEEERANSPTNDSPTANDLQVKAAAAIMGGAKYWDPYMEIFAEDADGKLNAADLAKLQPETDAAPHSEKNLARAYLIGNGNCGPASPTAGDNNLMFTVTETLD